jgi:hypothetical protein
MTPSRKKSSQWQIVPEKIRNQPYIIINLILSGIILLILLYSGIFSPSADNYPVVCIHEVITGEPCFSCGLSHSLSLIIRGRLNEALQWNVYGMRVFLFFTAQFFMRLAFSCFFMKNTDSRKQLIILDISGSVVLFLIAFWPFISNIIKQAF